LPKITLISKNQFASAKVFFVSDIYASLTCRHEKCKLYEWFFQCYFTI